MPSNLHLPEWRITSIEIGVPAESMNGYYIRAENEIEARRIAKKLTHIGPNETRIHVFSSSEHLRVQFWKEPLYPLTVG